MPTHPPTRPQVLRLENNRLEALPEPLGDLAALTKLDISTNCLRFLPPSMGRLRRIQRIDAANNMLVGGGVERGWWPGGGGGGGPQGNRGSWHVI
jgi:hypothetical protein